MWQRESPDELLRFCEAFRSGDAESAENMFSSYLERTISIRDTAVRNDLKESFYHGFLLGLLSYKKDWLVMSNQESGDGYTDILVEIDTEKTGIVIELKYADRDSLDEACRKALEQIEEKNYALQLYNDGMENILKYGISCCRKKCRVVLKRQEI